MKNVKKALSVIIVLCMFSAMICSFGYAEEEVTASVVLDTTGEAPTGNVPMYETLRISMTGAVPTGYQWKYKNSKSTGNPRNGGKTESYCVPSNYVEFSGDCEVWCEVTYSGGTITTDKVIMSKDYTNQVPYGYDNKYNDNHYKGLPNAENSDPNYVFYIGDKGFVIANERNVKGCAYFIVALDAYGDIYNGDNTPNEKVWKNYYGKDKDGFVTDSNGVSMQTKLLSEGNDFEGFEDATSGKYALPEVFENYIDMNHSWPYSGDKWGTVRQLKSGIALLSYGDYVNYSDRIGYKDNLYKPVGQQTLLLRDLYFTTESEWTNPAGRVISSNLVTSKESGPYLLRPCFWLKKDFFEKNAIDLTKAGSGVINIMKDSVYTEQQALKDTYIAAGKENDYNQYLNPNVNFDITVRRTGETADAAKLHDTLCANLSGLDGEYSYKWQVQGADGWTDAPADITNGNEIALMGKIEGMKLRAVATSGDTVISSSVITAPSIELYTEVPGTAAEPKALSNPENSADSNKFTIGGKGFVLLEESDNDVAPYYVTTTDSYGTANYITNGAKDPNKSYTAYGQFESSKLGINIMGDGNNYAGFIGADENDKAALPSGVSENIYSDAVWGRYVTSEWRGGPTWVSKKTSAPLQMLSQTDFVTYNSILGWKDNVFAKGGQYYLLRDCALKHQAWSENSVVNDQGKTTQITQSINADEGTQTIAVVRPVFYLKSDFFKSVKIDNLQNAGSKILALMKEKYWADDLMHLYDKATLRACGFKYKVNTTPTWTDKDGNPITNLSQAGSLKVSMNIENSYEDSKSAILILAVYNGDGRLLAVNMTDGINIIGKGNTMADCVIDGLNLSGESGVWASAMLWNGLVNMNAVTASVELR